MPDPRDVERARGQHASALSMMKMDIQRVIRVYASLPSIANQIRLDDEKTRMALADEILERTREVPICADVREYADTLRRSHADLVASAKRRRQDEEVREHAERLRRSLFADEAKAIESMLAIDTKDLNEMECIRLMRDVRLKANYLVKHCQHDKRFPYEYGVAKRALLTVEKFREEMLEFLYQLV